MYVCTCVCVWTTHIFASVYKLLFSLSICVPRARSRDKNRKIPLCIVNNARISVLLYLGLPLSKISFSTAKVRRRDVESENRCYLQYVEEKLPKRETFFPRKHWMECAVYIFVSTRSIAAKSLFSHFLILIPRARLLKLLFLVRFRLSIRENNYALSLSSQSIDFFWEEKERER